jgi:hypothetical protein
MHFLRTEILWLNSLAFAYFPAASFGHRMKIIEDLSALGTHSRPHRSGWHITACVSASSSFHITRVDHAYSRYKYEPIIKFRITCYVHQANWVSERTSASTISLIKQRQAENMFVISCVRAELRYGYNVITTLNATYSSLKYLNIYKISLKRTLV